MFRPASTFVASIEKYSDKTFSSAGEAASYEYVRAGADKAPAHSAETTHILESIMEVEGEREYYRIWKEQFEVREGNNRQNKEIGCTRDI